MPIEPKLKSYRFHRYYTALEPLWAQPRVRAYTMLILSLLAMSFFGYFAIRPTLTTISTLRRQISDARFVDQKLQEKINALTAVSVEYQKIKPDLGLILTALPKENKFAPFVKNLEELATESGTTISSLTFRPVDLSAIEATVSGQEMPISFSLSLTGDYTNLANFAFNLSRFERLIVIKKMEFSTKGETEGLRLNLEGETFYVQ